MSGSERGLSPVFVVLACLAGALLAWMPADWFYTTSRARHIGQGYFAKVQNPDLADDELAKLTRQAIFERRLYVGVVTALLGMAVCGCLGAVGGARRGGRAMALGGLVAGGCLGGALGLGAGFAGQVVAQKYPIYRFDSDLVQLVKTMSYHSLIFAIMSVGVGGVFAAFAARHLGVMKSLAVAVTSAVGAALVFTPLVSVAMPLVDTTSVVPPGTWSRLLWFVLPACFMGSALAMADRSRRQPASTPAGSRLDGPQ